MKKLVVTAAFLTSLVSLSARAQEPAPAPAVAAAPAAGKMTLGVDLAFMLPLSTWADATGLGFGGLVRGEYDVAPQLKVTGRAGYIYSLKKELAGGSTGGLSISMKNQINVIPIWVGAKYALTDMFYGAAEVGLNHLMFNSESSCSGDATTCALMGGMSGSSSEDKLGVNVGAGAIINGIDLRAQLSIFSIADTTDAMSVIVTAGYNFMSL